MVAELVLPTTLAEARSAIHGGGDGVREGVATILVGLHDYRENQQVGGVNVAQVLAAAMRRLTEDPYLTLGVDPESDNGSIKKAYRKLALKYHPDKNSATPKLFQAVQGAHDILIEPDKRAEYDIKRKRQQEALDRLRKHPKTEETSPSSSSPSSTTPTARGGDPTTNSNGTSKAPNTSSSTSSPGAATQTSTASGAGGGHPGGRSSEKFTAGGGKAAGAEAAGAGEGGTANRDEKVRQFNKRFYEEFKRESHRHNKAKTGKGAAAAATGASTHQPPPRPKIRSTNRTDSTITLEWHCKELPATTAYELQWRQRGRAASDWVSGFQSDGVGSTAAADKARAQVEEARRRRSQSQKGNRTGATSQFRSSSIAGDSDANEVGASSRTSPAATASPDDGKCPGTQENSAESAESPVSGQDMAKTNSGYWRRMSRAAEQDSERDASEEGKGKEKARRRTLQPQGTPSEGAWMCIVCKRQNEPSSKSCWVCYTARRASYQSVNLERIRTDTEETPPGSARRGSLPSNASYASVKPSTEKQRDQETPPSIGLMTPERYPASKSNSRNRYSYSAAVSEPNEGAGGISDKVPSIRVHRVSSEHVISGGPGDNNDGIHVRTAGMSPTTTAAAAAAAAAAEFAGGNRGGRSSAGQRDGAAVWEFTEGDLDSVGRGATDYGSDDNWSYAEGATGIDTKSDPGDIGPSTSWRRKSVGAAPPSSHGVSSRQRRGSTASGDSGRGGSSRGAGGGVVEAPKSYLNGRITKLHLVRAEPIEDAAVVGYLVATKEVEVLAEVGNWFKVRWHKQAKEEGNGVVEARGAPKERNGDANSQQSTAEEPPGVADGAAESGNASAVGGKDELAEDVPGARDRGLGWCLTRDSKHQYIVTMGDRHVVPDFQGRRCSSAGPSRRKSAAGRRRSSVSAYYGGYGEEDYEDEDEGECWHELKHEDGSVYYFNTASGVSQWEPPLWLDEIDPTSGAVYYVNSYSGEPQWEQPTDFVPIVRENPYATTPEQEFIKSVLSPMRSKGPKSFHEAMNGGMKATQEPSEEHLNTVEENAVAGMASTARSPRNSIA